MAGKPTSTILIVTGAHLAAEVHDRPLAYHLRERILHSPGHTTGQSLSQSSNTATTPSDLPPEPVIVCSDLWYLNREDLRDLPTISIGGPAVNAFTAFLADKLPSVYAVDGVLIVQADWDQPTPLACCWGMSAHATATAVEIFANRYLEDWLGAAVG